eukprot:jgi/Mesen1/8408/ME000470S07792
MGTSCLLLPGAVWLGLSVHPRLQESRFLGPILSSMKPTNDAFRHVSPWPVGTRRLPSFRMKGIRGIKTKAGNWRKAVSPESTSDDTVQENLDLASPDIEVSGQQHSGFNSWLPPEKKEMEECSGWSTPLGLDRTLTDVFVHAGLAEAGLIKSRLSHMDVINNENDGQAGSGVSSALSDRFLPDSPVRRQDLISWKIALEQRTLPAPDKQILRAVSGLIDVDRIDIDALPAVAFDILQGDGSMISSAFGYTRRFEPSKPEALGKEKEELVRRQAQVEETAQQLLSSQKRLAAEQGAAYMLQMEVELQQQSARSERQQIDLEREQLAAAK